MPDIAFSLSILLTVFSLFIILIRNTTLILMLKVPMPATVVKATFTMKIESVNKLKGWRDRLSNFTLMVKERRFEFVYDAFQLRYF